MNKYIFLAIIWGIATCGIVHAQEKVVLPVNSKPSNLNLEVSKSLILSNSMPASVPLNLLGSGSVYTTLTVTAATVGSFNFQIHPSICYYKLSF